MDFAPLIASVVSIQQEEFEELGREPHCQLLCCTHCSFKCTSVDTLEVHQASTHLCHICGWSFKEKHNLERHRRSHARAEQARAANLYCKFCGLGFVNNKILIRHILVEHQTQQEEFLAKSLCEEQNKSVREPQTSKSQTPSAMIQTSSRSPKTHSLPKLLSTGFFHPTLKGSVSTSEIVSPGLLGASKRSFGKTHNKVWKIQKNKKYIEETVRVKEEIIEKDTSIAGMSASATEITESLDKMLEDFEKEEEEARNEEIKEGVLSSQEGILIENCNETLDKTEKNNIVEDKSNKTMDKTVEVNICENGNKYLNKNCNKTMGKVQENNTVADKNSEKGHENLVEKKIDKVLEACEAEYLNNKVEDELLGDEGKNQYEKTMFIVKNSKIVGRLKTVRKVEHLIVDTNPFQHKSTESVFDKYSRFWEVIGLVPTGIQKQREGRRGKEAEYKARKRKKKPGISGSRDKSSVPAKKFCSPRNSSHHKKISTPEVEVSDSINARGSKRRSEENVRGTDKEVRGIEETMGGEDRKVEINGEAEGKYGKMAKTDCGVKGSVGGEMKESVKQPVNKSDMEVGANRAKKEEVQEQGKKEGVHSCKQCGEIFQSAVGLGNHKRVHKEGREESQVRRKDEGGERVECGLCGKNCTSHTGLLYHLTQAHFQAAINKMITDRFPGFWLAERRKLGKEQVCSQCGVVMMTRAALQKHIGVTHEAVWPLYKLAQSGDQLLTSGEGGEELLNLVKLKPKNKKEQRLKIRLKKTEDTIKNISKDKTERSKCEDTSKEITEIFEKGDEAKEINETSKSEDNGKAEIKTIILKRPKDGLGNPEGKFDCDKCNFRTKFHWYLKRHMLEKHDVCKDYLYHCDSCKFSTNENSYLIKHLKNKHAFDKIEDVMDHSQPIMNKEVKPTHKSTEREAVEVETSLQEEKQEQPHVQKELSDHEEKLPKSKKKNGKERKRRSRKVSGDFIDWKLGSVPDINPYSRQLPCHRKTAVSLVRENPGPETLRSESLTEPYCRVCQLLLEPEVRLGLAEKGRTISGRPPKQSMVWVPGRQGDGSEEVSVSPLLVCSSCQLCVHRACYLLPDITQSHDWVCEACTLGRAARCSLCLQGGADLKRTLGGSLAHVTCSLLLPETRVSTDGQIDLSRVPGKRRGLECFLCGGIETSPGVHCQASKECRVSFHPGCATRDRVDIVVGPRGRLILRCGFCVEKFDLRSEDQPQVGKFQPQDIVVGETVGVGDGKQGVVVEVVPEEYYSVAFDDGTFCDNLDPAEVKYDQKLELVLNTEVVVEWEGRPCTGLFKGSNRLLWYQVRPNDGGEVQELDRTQIYKLET